ncbi:MAG: isochorismatase family cysteine hydrolase [bacterium]
MIRNNFLKDYDFSLLLGHSLIRYDSSKINTDNTALIVVDMQRFFTDTSSPAFIPSASTITGSISALMEAFTQSRKPVILTRHINNEGNAGMMKERYSKLITSESELSLIDSCFIRDGVKTVEKTQFNAFYNSQLEEYLRNADISRVILTGVMTERCLSTTAREAFVRGYEPIIPVDCTATYYRQVYESALISLSNSVAELSLMGDIDV